MHPIYRRHAAAVAVRAARRALPMQGIVLGCIDDFVGDAGGSGGSFLRRGGDPFFAAIDVLYPWLEQVASMSDSAVRASAARYPDRVRALSDAADDVLDAMRGASTSEMEAFNDLLHQNYPAVTPAIDALARVGQWSVARSGGVGEFHFKDATLDAQAQAFVTALDGMYPWLTQLNALPEAAKAVAVAQDPLRIMSFMGSVSSFVQAVTTQHEHTDDQEVKAFETFLAGKYPAAQISLSFQKTAGLVTGVVGAIVTAGYLDDLVVTDTNGYYDGSQRAR